MGYKSCRQKRVKVYFIYNNIIYFRLFFLMKIYDDFNKIFCFDIFPVEIASSCI